MKLITWNVNSVRVRLPRLLALLERHQPDLVLLQETKAQDAQFPREPIEALGYRCELWGQKTYNGVAILSRRSCDQVQQGFPGNPLPEEARVLSCEVAGVQLVNLYVVNGKAVSAPHFQRKLQWMDALIRWLGEEKGWQRPLLLAGDFNIAPEDRDVYAPDRWRGRVLFSEPEHLRLQSLMDLGLVDLLRLHRHEEGIYSWWDYRAGSFPKDHGLRIDLILGNELVARRCVSVEIDREERGQDSGEGKPSDHAPVVATFEDSPGPWG